MNEDGTLVIYFDEDEIVKVTEPDGPNTGGS